MPHTILLLILRPIDMAHLLLSRELVRAFHSGAHSSEENKLYNQDITPLTLRIYVLSNLKIAWTISHLTWFKYLKQICQFRFFRLRIFAKPYEKIKPQARDIPTLRSPKKRPSSGSWLIIAAHTKRPSRKLISNSFKSFTTSIVVAVYPWSLLVVRRISLLYNSYLM